MHINRVGNLEDSISGFVESLRTPPQGFHKVKKAKVFDFGFVEFSRMWLCGILKFNKAKILEDSADTEVGSSGLSLGIPFLELGSSGTPSRTLPLVVLGDILKDSASGFVESSRTPLLGLHKTRSGVLEVATSANKKHVQNESNLHEKKNKHNKLTVKQNCVPYLRSYVVHNTTLIIDEILIMLHAIC